MNEFDFITYIYIHNIAEKNALKKKQDEIEKKKRLATEKLLKNQTKIRKNMDKRNKAAISIQRFYRHCIATRKYNNILDECKLFRKAGVNCALNRQNFPFSKPPKEFF